LHIFFEKPMPDDPANIFISPSKDFKTLPRFFNILYVVLRSSALVHDAYCNTYTPINQYESTRKPAALTIVIQT